MSKKDKNEKTSKPMVLTYEDDPLKDPWAKLRKRRGVTIHSEARRDP